MPSSTTPSSASTPSCAIPRWRFSWPSTCVRGRSRRAILVAALMVLVKEDGAVLCACVLVAFFAPRLWALRAAAPEERRPVARRRPGACWPRPWPSPRGWPFSGSMGRVVTLPQETAEARVLDSLRNVGHAVAGHGAAAREPSVGSRRLRRGGRPDASCPSVAGSSEAWRSCSCRRHRSWPSSWWRPARIASGTCSGPIGSRRSRPSRSPASSLALPASTSVGRRPMVRVAALLALTWAAQLFVLDRAEGYSPWARLQAPALLKGEGTRASTVPPEELRFLRCLGERLPRGLPVSSFGDLHPVFHRQSVVFEARLERARHAPRLRVVPASPTRLRRPRASAAVPGSGASRYRRNVVSSRWSRAVVRTLAIPRAERRQAARAPSRSCTRRKSVAVPVAARGPVEQGQQHQETRQPPERPGVEVERGQQEDEEVGEAEGRPFARRLQPPRDHEKRQRDEDRVVLPHEGRRQHHEHGQGGPGVEDVAAGTSSGTRRRPAGSRLPRPRAPSPGPTPWPASLTRGRSTTPNGPPSTAAVLRRNESIEFSRKHRSAHA